MEDYSNAWDAAKLASRDGASIHSGLERALAQVEAEQAAMEMAPPMMEMEVAAEAEMSPGS